MHLHAALARALADMGATPLFGLIGDANLYLVDEYIKLDGCRYIDAVNENGAVLMAMGAAMVSGGVGFATVTHGPALTNCVTALAEATKSNTPMVLLCGDTDPVAREHLQNIEQRPVILASGAGFEQMRSPETAVADLARAVRRAKAERRPIAFNMPVNHAWTDVSYAPVSTQMPPVPMTELPEEALNEAIGMIAAARRPLILAGRGAIDPASRAALLRLARRIEAPLATTIRARGLFRGEDYALGVHGSVSTPAAADAIQGADCLIAFGASLNYHTTADGAFVRDRRVIQIADRMQDLGVCAEPDLGILGHPASVADTFVHWLDEAEIPGSGFTAQLPAQGLDVPEMIPAPGAAEDTVEFLPTMAALNDMLPEDRTIVTDVGRWMVRGYQMMTAPGPLDHVTSASFAAIGLGLATAIGAAAMRPDRPTVLVCGDGGFMLGNLTEFHSAVRAESDLIVIVFNDSSYGAEHIQFRNKQRDPSISLFNWPDFASVARALGGDGMTLRQASDLDTLRQALDTRDPKRPYLIDVRIDPNHVATW